VPGTYLLTPEYHAWLNAPDFGRRQQDRRDFAHTHGSGWVYRTSGRYTDASGGVGGWTAHAYPYDQIDHYYTDAERNTYAAWTTENDRVVSVEGNPMEPHEFDEQQLL
jgi:hypothetical protein